MCENLTHKPEIHVVDDSRVIRHAATTETIITEALVSEMMQYIISGDFSRIPEYLLFRVAECLAPFLEYVNSRTGQHVTSAGGTGER